MSNPYDSNLDINTFLRTAYLLMIKNINRLIEIENTKKYNKLPLEVLQEKLETSSKILQSLLILSNMLDYDKPESEILSG